MNRKLLAAAIVIGGMLLLTLFALELVVRLGTHRDADGNAWFRAAHLRPFHPAVKHVEQLVAEYQSRPDSVMIYDRDLGWSPRPGFHHHGPRGLLSTKENPPETPAPGTLRIALFGASYTEATFEHGWWRTLEEASHAEVLNFGVAGYGMDQALLRWRRDGMAFHPHVVIFGFQSGNAFDNVNMLRAVKDFESGIPFLKPRFILQAEKLSLINSPTPEPTQIADLLRRLPAWPLLPQEHFYRSQDYDLTPLRCSRLAAWLETRSKAENRADYYDLSQEPAAVSLAIARQFRREVEAAGQRFVLIHLPHELDLLDLREHGKMLAQPLLDQLGEVAHLEQPLYDACAGAPISASFTNGHYSERLHVVAGQALAAWLQAHPR